MKPVLLSKFRPNKFMVARTWGTVNHTQKTTDKRASYFDCNGHGGYVCNPSDFSDEELAKLGPFGKGNYDVRVAIASSNVNGELYVLGVSYEHSGTRKINYSPFEFTFIEWKTIPMMIFEEDCNWAVLTYKLGIDLVEMNKYSKEERLESARKCVKQYNSELL